MPDGFPRSSMTAGGTLVFAGALLLAASTPGPATMTVLARVLARGTRGTIGFCTGLVIGDLVWLTTAALGLAAVAEQSAPVLRAISYAGAAYLLVLARAFWTAPPTPPTPSRAQTRWGIVQGLALQLGNPKVVLFYVALLPVLVPIDQLTALDLAILALIVACVIAAVNSVYVGFAVVVRRHVGSPRSLLLLHRFSAAVMVVAAALIVWTTWRG